jgi:hypothetical protein
LCIALLGSPAAQAELQEAPAPSAARAVPAVGSTVGPWAWMELGGYVGSGTFVEPSNFGSGGPWTKVSTGWGFEVGRVHLRPAAHFGLGVELGDRDTAIRIPSVFMTPLALSLAATDLLDEGFTGLRLTPAVGLTIPTLLDAGTPFTTLSVALQLERRFGPIEVALRSEAGKPLYVITAPRNCGSQLGCQAAARRT